jgi:hypothetical protein
MMMPTRGAEVVLVIVGVGGGTIVGSSSASELVAPENFDVGGVGDYRVIFEIFRWDPVQNPLGALGGEDGPDRGVSAFKVAGVDTSGSLAPYGDHGVTGGALGAEEFQQGFAEKALGNDHHFLECDGVDTRRSRLQQIRSIPAPFFCWG